MAWRRSARLRARALLDFVSRVSRLGKIRGAVPFLARPLRNLDRARSDWEVAMKRREFLKSMTALAAGGVLPAAPAVWSPAKAQSRQETSADRVRERSQQHRHPRRRHQRARLRGVLELLRPSHQPRDEDARERDAILRPRQVQDGARRRHEARRHVRHLQAEEERGLPRRHAGHRQGRQMVVRPRRHRRRLSRPSRWAPAR